MRKPLIKAGDDPVLEELIGLDALSNLFGPLHPDIRTRLLRVINKPSNRTWDNAYTLIVCPRGIKTLWQLWIEIDPSAVRSKPCGERWPQIPTREQLFEMLRRAAAINQEVTHGR